MAKVQRRNVLRPPQPRISRSNSDASTSDGSPGALARRLSASLGLGSIDRARRDSLPVDTSASGEADFDVVYDYLGDLTPHNTVAVVLTLPSELANFRLAEWAVRSGISPVVVRLFDARSYPPPRLR
jgi:hypothetical protein